MTTHSYQKSDPLKWQLRNLRLKRGTVFIVIIIAALLAFELFNYSTTEFALSDLLGELTFVGIRWATILSIAFCSIDFAGIARLFTPGTGAKTQKESGYLFGAWLLAATMNAMLTWWGISIAILNHKTPGNAVIDQTTMLRVIPIFVAMMVWVIRVLIIGTLSVAGERLFMNSQANARVRRGTINRSNPTSRDVGMPEEFSPHNSRRLPKTRGPKPKQSFAGDAATGNQPLNRTINPQLKSQERFNQPTSPAESVQQREPEYVSVDQPDIIDVAASPPRPLNMPGPDGMTRQR